MGESGKEKRKKGKVERKSWKFETGNENDGGRWIEYEYDSKCIMRGRDIPPPFKEHKNA